MDLKPADLLDTVCISSDLDKLYLLNWWFDFRLKPIFAAAQAASKNIAHFKNGRS